MFTSANIRKKYNEFQYQGSIFKELKLPIGENFCNLTTNNLPKNYSEHYT